MQPARSPSPEGYRAPGGLAVVATARSTRAARHSALVLHALGIPHAQAEHEGQILLLVEPEQAARAAAELEAYERENHTWPPQADLPEVLSVGSLAAGLWSAALLLFFLAQVN